MVVKESKNNIKQILIEITKHNTFIVHITRTRGVALFMKALKKYNPEVREIGNKLLMTTCRKAIERSKQTEGTYKNVKCSFKSAKKFYNSAKSNNKLYEVWLEHTKIYLENGKDLSFRPTFDRINGQGHYYFNNIQVLTHGKNASKARRKKK
jgi:hypothetical protein